MSSNEFSWNGLSLPNQAECLRLPDGRVLEDAIIWPSFLQQELGIDAFPSVGRSPGGADLAEREGDPVPPGREQPALDQGEQKALNH